VGGGDLERGSGYFSSISLCFKGDDQRKVANFLRKNVHPRENPGYAYRSGPTFQRPQILQRKKHVYALLFLVWALTGVVNQDFRYKGCTRRPTHDKLIILRFGVLGS